MNIILVKNPKTGQLEPIPAIKGASAYEIAVKNGFEGTKEEWLVSLRGPQGEPGPQGADGKDGSNGKDGEDGKDGNDYILTEQDKREIADMVKVPTIEEIIAALPIYNGEVIEE